MAWERAVRSQRKLRIAIMGPSGAGKTHTSLAIATGLAGENGKIALIDTEGGKASAYADLFSFDRDILADPYTPERYIELIESAAKHKYDVLVVDSISHEWAGKGGLLEDQDRLEKSGRFKSSFATWGEITPRHNLFLEAIQGFPGHIICTLRTKTGYAMEQDDKGKVVPKRVGLQPMQREGIEYEFDFFFDVNPEHSVTAVRDNAGLFQGRILTCPGLELGQELREWSETGTPLRPRPSEPPAQPAQGKKAVPAEPAKPTIPTATAGQREGLKQFAALWSATGRGRNAKDMYDWISKTMGLHVTGPGALTEEQWAEAAELFAVEAMEAEAQDAPDDKLFGEEEV